MLADHGVVQRAVLQGHLEQKGSYPEYIVDEIPAENAEMQANRIRDFYGRNYVRVHARKVHRIAGREAAGHFYIYVLYKRADLM